MGGGGTDRPPYWTGYHLSGWVVGHLDYLRGKLIQAGRDLSSMPTTDLLDFAVATIVDGAVAALPGRTVEEIISAARDIWSQPPWPDREFWGTTRKAQREAAAVADLVGGPAPLREDG